MRQNLCVFDLVALKHYPSKVFLVAKVTLESQMSVHHQKPSDPKYQIYLTYISDLSYSYDYQVDQFCKIAQNYQLKFCEVSLTKI